MGRWRDNEANQVRLVNAHIRSDPDEFVKLAKEAADHDRNDPEVMEQLRSGA